MHAEPTTVIIQRYLDALPGDPAAEPVVRELLQRAAGRLRVLCATFLYKSYPRLTRPPVNLETDELLGGVVARLLTALRTTRPATVRRFVLRRQQARDASLLGRARSVRALEHPGRPGRRASWAKDGHSRRTPVLIMSLTLPAPAASRRGSRP
jgi:hypothetical protein